MTATMLFSLTLFLFIQSMTVMSFPLKRQQGQELPKRSSLDHLVIQLKSRSANKDSLQNNRVLRSNGLSVEDYEELGKEERSLADKELLRRILNHDLTSFHKKGNPKRIENNGIINRDVHETDFSEHVSQHPDRIRDDYKNLHLFQRGHNIKDNGPKGKYDFERELENIMALEKESVNKIDKSLPVKKSIEELNRLLDENDVEREKFHNSDFDKKDLGAAVNDIEGSFQLRKDSMDGAVLDVVSKEISPHLEREVNKDSKENAMLDGIRELEVRDFEDGELSEDDKIKVLRGLSDLLPKRRHTEARNKRENYAGSNNKQLNIRFPRKKLKKQLNFNRILGPHQLKRQLSEYAKDYFKQKQKRDENLESLRVGALADERKRSNYEDRSVDSLWKN